MCENELLRREDAAKAKKTLPKSTPEIGKLGCNGNLTCLSKIPILSMILVLYFY